MRLARLGEVATIERSVASETECKELPYVGLESIEKGTGAFAGDFEATPESVLAAKYRFTSKHVLYGKLRPYLNKVVLPSFDGVCSTEILPILPRAEVLDRVYLWAALLSPEFVRWASARVDGANLPRLSPQLLARWEIPVPPLSEQRHIASVLFTADRLRRLRRYALQLSEEYPQAVFLEMFGDPAVNPKGWRWAEVGGVARIIVPTRDKPKQFRGSTPWVTLPDLDGLFVDCARNLLSHEDAAAVGNRLMPAGTVLLSCAGSLGRVAVARRELYANQQFYGLVPKPGVVISLYLAQALATLGERFYLGLAGISTIGFFSKGKALGIRIPLPPLDAQEQFARVVRGLEGLRVQQREALRQAEHLFETLLHRAFRGEL